MPTPSLIDELRLRFEYWLFDLPAEVGGRPLQFAMGPLRFAYALVRDFFRGDLGLRAMSLVYSSLFALVPAIVVSFSVLKAFGYNEELQPLLFEFLRPLGVRGYEITARVMSFVENAETTVFGTVGFVLLVWTIFLMIQKIEDALNFTWHVERPRSLAKRVIEYIVIMIVGPVVAIGAIVVLAQLEASDVIGRLSGGGATVSGAQDSGNGHFAPYVMIIGLFWFVYGYMPNTRVRWQASLIGAFFGGTLWVIVGAIFARVVAYATQTAAIYAGFAIVFLFLVWLHLSWLIMLLGAQLSFYVQHPDHLRTGHGEIPVTAALRERIALGAMYLIGQRFIEGGPRWNVSALADRMDVPASCLDSALCNLEDRGLVLTVEDDTVAPDRDLASITLAEILDAIRHETPDPRRPVPHSVPAADAAARAADAAMREKMSQSTLRELVQGPTPSDVPAGPAVRNERPRDVRTG